MNCEWLTQLTEYRCRHVRGLSGGDALSISTPFTMSDGSPLAVYLLDQGSTVLLSDNGDSLAQISATGVDPFRYLPSLRKRTQRYGLTLTQTGAFEAICRKEVAPITFARAVSGLLQVADWAAEAMQARRPEPDLAQEALPYILARDRNAPLERHRAVIGASNSTHVFDIRHGGDLIDVIPAKAQATGAEMRKVADVQNGPFAESLRPLVIVDDRQDFDRAQREIAIIGSIARAMSFSALIAPRH